MSLRGIRDLLSSVEIAKLEGAPLFGMDRHPTWFPLSSTEPRAIDFLVNKAIANISAVANDDAWLRNKVSALMDFDDIRNASAALAEIRAYGALLECAFKVTPIPETRRPTPDFHIDAGDGRVAVEVFSKHQDQEMDRMLNAIADPGQPLPAGIRRNTREIRGGNLTTTIIPITLAGPFQPRSLDDTPLANLVSRLCAVKQEEKQIPGDMPSVLVLDAAHFGGPHIPNLSGPAEAAAVQTGHVGITAGPYWYAFYGWKGAPLFQPRAHRMTRMAHEGRFRLIDEDKSKLSAILVVFAQASILLENPWAAHRLPDRSRLSLCCYPWFDLSHSICNWSAGDAELQVNLQRRMIETMERNYSAFWDQR